MPSSTKNYEPVVRTRVLVREVMNSPILSASPEEDIRTISEKMSRARVSSVVVLKGNSPVGILTDGDIVSRVVAKDLVPSAIRAEQVMSSPLRTIGSERQIIEAARQMLTNKIKRLGVSYKGDLVGIISISDIVAITPELFDIISEKRAILASDETAGRPRSYLAGYCDHCNQWSDVLLEVDNRFLCEECRSGRATSEELFEEPSE
jgi:signal-transduction protein with cAMP-binding, CBS, and nucleotidyltransferase domain